MDILYVCVCDKNQVEIGQVINMMRGSAILEYFLHPCFHHSSHHQQQTAIAFLLPDDPHRAKGEPGCSLCCVKAVLRHIVCVLIGYTHTFDISISFFAFSNRHSTVLLSSSYEAETWTSIETSFLLCPSFFFPFCRHFGE